MKILHVIDDLQLGGAERNLASVLPLLGAHQHTVVYMLEESAYAPALRAAGVRVEHVPVRGPRQSLRALAAVRDLAGEADLVHTQRWVSDLVGRVAATARKPVVTTVQTSPYEPSVLAGYRRRGRLVYRALWLSDAVLSRLVTRLMVGVSDYVREMIVRRLRVPRAQTRRVYNAVAVDQFRRLEGAERAAVRGELGLADDDIAVVTVGHVVPLKGQATLIEAMPALLATVPTAVLLVIGDGSERPRLEHRCRELGLGDRVRWAGLRGDVPRLLGAVDAFASASRLEGLPLSVVEAMASGLPCVLSPIAPHREMASLFGAEHAADMVVAANDAPSWARSLGRVLASETLRQSLSGRGVGVARDHFDARVTAPALGRVFEEAVGHT